MDLTYADENGKDIGVLLAYDLDMAFGEDENDFELTLDIADHCLCADYKMYMENTEYGGIVDCIKPDSDNHQISYSGRTWQGVFARKIIQPDSGSDYYTVSGDANIIIGYLITRLGLSDLFRASTASSGLTVTSYRFDRYIDAYAGLRKMLLTVDGKLHFNYIDGKVEISALPLVDYSQDEQFDTDQVKLTITQKCNGINHLICLGKGDLKDRTVVHLYVDALGNISTTQSITGASEIVDVYDYANATDAAELTSRGIDKLKEQLPSAEGQITLDVDNTVLDIGDIVGAKDIITGISVSVSVNKKIVTIKDGYITISYKVGG